MLVYQRVKHLRFLTISLKNPGVLRNFDGFQIGVKTIRVVKEFVKLPPEQVSPGNEDGCIASPVIGERTEVKILVKIRYTSNTQTSDDWLPSNKHFSKRKTSIEKTQKRKKSTEAHVERVYLPEPTNLSTSTTAMLLARGKCRFEFGTQQKLESFSIEQIIQGETQNVCQHMPTYLSGSSLSITSSKSTK